MTDTAATLITAGSYFFELVTFLILINIVLSWFQLNPSNPFVKIIRGLTEPLLAPFRRFAIWGPLDFSPIVVVLLIQIVIFPLYRWIVMLIF
ncbi:MAG: YggT family protein [Eubacterium sp.]|nr:YggT family protein [Eubacterium sp.]